jgi:multicomponent Na+:H+ antiporter subunit D
MHIINSPKPLFAILASGLVVALLIASRRNDNVRVSWSFVAAVIKFGIVASMVPTIWAGNRIEYTLFEVVPRLSDKLGPITVKFAVDPFGMVFALVASSLWILAVFYSMGYMRGLHEHAQTRFDSCFALALFGAVGGAMAGNFFTLYLFYEIVSVCTYPLVAHHQDEEGYDGAKKYMTYLTGTAKGFVLPALVLTYVTCGTLDFPDNAMTGIFPADANPTLVTILFSAASSALPKRGDAVS